MKENIKKEPNVYLVPSDFQASGNGFRCSLQEEVNSWLLLKASESPEASGQNSASTLLSSVSKRNPKAFQIDDPHVQHPTPETCRTAPFWRVQSITEMALVTGPALL